MDIVNIQCPECHGQIGINRDDLGHRVRCPLCQQIILAAEPPTHPGGPPFTPEPEPTAPFPESPLPASESPSQDIGMVPGPGGPGGPFTPPDLSSPPGVAPLSAGPAEVESIFGPPEDVSEDLFGGPGSPLVDIPPSERGAAIVDEFTRGRAPQEGPGAGDPYHPAADIPSGPPVERAAPVLEDHSEPGAPSLLREDEPGPAGTDAGTLPAPAPALPRHKAGSGILVSTLLIALIPYSIFSTCVIAYLIYQQRNFSSDPTIRYLEKMLDDNFRNPNKQEIKRIQHDMELPQNLKVPLKGELEIGAIEVRPLKVTQSAEGDLILYLRVKNVSEGEDRVQLNPLPARYAKHDPKKSDAPKPYVFLDAGRHRIYGGKVQWYAGAGDKLRPAASNQISPGDEMTISLTTPPEDRSAVLDILGSKDPLLWRVQLLRGLEHMRGGDWPVSCVIGVPFRSSDVVRFEPKGAEPPELPALP